MLTGVGHTQAACTDAWQSTHPMTTLSSNRVLFLKSHGHPGGVQAAPTGAAFVAGTGSEVLAFRNFLAEKVDLQAQSKDRQRSRRNVGLLPRLRGASAFHGDGSKLVVCEAP